MIFLRASFILLLLCSPFLGWSYEVEFCGNLTKKIKELLNNESQLILFQNNPPPSEAGLRYRAEGDIANFLRVMTSQAYYGASVDLKYDFQKKILSSLFQ